MLRNSMVGGFLNGDSAVPHLRARRPARDEGATAPWQISEGRFGKRVAVLRDLTPPEAAELAELAPAEIEISARKAWAGSNIEFLSALHGVRSLHLITMRGPDLRPISGLHSLVELTITCGSRRGTDLSGLHELKVCSLQWLPEFEGIFDLGALEDLSIASLPARISPKLNNLTRLRNLQLLDSGIADLRALGGMPELSSLCLGALNRITTLEPLAGLSGLKHIDINTCKGLNGIEPIVHLQSVVTFWLNNCGIIPTLKPLLNSVNLERLSFYESTNIRDGDIACLLALEKLRPTVSFQDRSHYNMNRTELNDILKKRNGTQ